MTGKEESSWWQDKGLAGLLLLGMLFVIFRVLRDFGRQGLSISQGEAETMETVNELAAEEDGKPGEHND